MLLLEGFSAARAVASAVGALPVGPASVTMPCTCQVPAGVSPATLLMGCEAGGCGPSRLPLALFSLLGVPWAAQAGGLPAPLRLLPGAVPGTSRPQVLRSLCSPRQPEGAVDVSKRP